MESVTKLERLSGVIGAMEMMYAFVSESDAFGRAVDDEFEAALEQLHMLEKQLRADETSGKQLLREPLTIDEALTGGGTFGGIYFNEDGKPYVRLGCAFTKEEFIDAMNRRHEVTQNAKCEEE